MATALETTGPRPRKDGFLGGSRGNAIWSWLSPIIWITAIGGLSYGGWTLFQKTVLAESSKAGPATGTAGPLTYPVVRSRLLVTIVDDGNVESAKNIDVKCQVAGGAAILWIVPDGKEVEEGELLVKLDQSTIEDQLNTQQIALGKTEASKIQAHENFEAAEIAVQEYAEGTYVKELQLAEASITNAQENLRSSENLLEHTRKMSRKGFATSLQVEADEFAVERSKLELESAKTSKRVLQDFSRKKMLKELEAKREAAKALQGSELAAFNLEKARRDRLEKQLGNCEIKAPQKGMVIYANDAGGGRYGSSQGPKIEEGATVRESQTILRLPDLSNMQVKMTVHESKVERLHIGMPASIHISGKEFRGKVSSIANQPEAASFFSASIKEYATIVKIDGVAEGLKPGMTAEVEVLVADLADVLAVPVSCTKELGNKTFVWVAGTNKHEQREVVTGQTNDKMVEIREGLKEGDVVMLNVKELYDEAIKEQAKRMPEAVDAEAKFGRSALKVDPNAPKNGGDRKAAGPNAAGASGGGFKLTVPEIMKQDKDKDGKISQDEANEQLKKGWSQNDTNGDNFLDRDEVKAMVERFAKKMREKQQNGGPPTGPGG